MKKTIINKITGTLCKKIFFAASLTTLAHMSTYAGGPMVLRLDVTGNSMQNETSVYFASNGSFHYNAVTDSRSLGVNPGYLNIVSVFDSVDCVIKGMPVLDQNMSIPLKITTGTAGPYQITGTQIQNLPAGACLMLHDNFTNADFNLRSGSYSCSISDTENIVRFILNISITPISISTGAFDPTCSASGDGMLTASTPGNSGSWSYYWKDSLNNIIKITSSKISADTLTGLNAGWYRVDVTASGTCMSGSSDYYLHGINSPYSLFTVSDTAADLSTAIEFWNGSFNADSYWWDFGDGEGTSDTNTTHLYASPGVFTAKLIAINSYCGDSAIQTREITVSNNETTSINKVTLQNKNILISRDAQGYYVMFSGNSERNAAISVYDMMGGKVMSDIEVLDVKVEKIRVPLPDNSANQLLIISVTTEKNEKSFVKILN